MQLVIKETMPEVLVDDFTSATNENWTRDYQLKDGEAPIPIAPGWKFYMEMYGAAGLVLTSSTDNGRIAILDRATGIIGLRVSQDDTSQIVPGKYDYDIVLVSESGVFRIAKGSIIVEKGVTNVPGNEKRVHYHLISRP